jgi:hypothetical protein
MTRRFDMTFLVTFVGAFAIAFFVGGTVTFMLTR